MADLRMEKDERLKVRGVPDIVKMNQLQNLLHDALIATNHVQSCAILKRKDAVLRASSVGFSLASEQIHQLLDAFRSPPQTREDGLYFDGKHYRCVRADNSSIYGKHGKRGVILVRTATLVLLATYSDQMCPSVCVEAVEKLGE
ncbi:hypothetical protein NP493_149g03025 [Ridgeia piscesae]|uniref:Profilin n=1 Tax=Ridgeia piscesae TaxID=27915 RepID=A0AAD9P4E7_RIDPI|nr:hypothetical protein NP493_149g03025 [Ridgeia piscesae]